MDHKMLRVCISRGDLRNIIMCIVRRYRYTWCFCGLSTSHLKWLESESSGSSDAYVKGGQKVGGPSDDVLEFQVGQGPVAVDVALLEDLLAAGRDLVVAQAAVHELTARALQVGRAHEPVVVEICGAHEAFYAVSFMLWFDFLGILACTVDLEGVEDFEVAGRVLREDGHHLEEVLEADAVLVGLARGQRGPREHLADALSEWILLICDRLRACRCERIL